MKLLQRLKNLFLPEGKISDGFHSFDELYHYRMLYNAAFFNSLEGKYEVHKSYRHSDGELCFGGGWFIVMAYLPTDAWFDYNVQKMCSVAASMATLVFNRRFQEQIVELSYNGKLDDELTSSYKRSLKTGAMFDARCFNIPKEEVTNCILWRQQDATRNSISSAGQAHFSHKQLEGLNSNQIQELLFQEKGINWNDYPTKFKRGSCCIKKYHQTMNQTLRSYWFIDNEIPIFKGEDREYIEKLIA